MSDDPVIGVVGLGKLGVCLASVLSDSGFTVWGADKSADLVTAVNSGAPPNGWEPGVTELVRAWGLRIASLVESEHGVPGVDPALTDTAAVAACSDVVFIVTPTPSLPSGEFDDQYVRQAVAEVCGGFLLRDRPGRPVIVVVSTLQPGSADSIAAQMRRASPDVGAALVVSPAFIALGSVVADLRNPDVWLIGTEDAHAALTLSAVYRRLSPDSDQRIIRPIECELSKIAVNVHLSIRAGFANTIARVCESFPGADASVVLTAIRSDKRIGAGFMRHGSFPGGVCLPRDLRAWGMVHSNADADWCQVAEAANNDVTEWVMDRVNEALMRLEHDEPRGFADVAVWSLSYKAGVPVATDSLGTALCEALAFERVDFCVYDPICAHPDLKAWASEADALTCPIVICCSEVPQELAVTSQSTVIDVWSCVTIPESREGVTLIRPGVHHVPPRTQ